MDDDMNRGEIDAIWAALDEDESPESGPLTARELNLLSLEALGRSVRPAVGDDLAYWLREMSEERTCIYLDTLREAAQRIEQLERTLADRNQWNDHLAAEVSSLLLAVPRPFRMMIHRRARRIADKEAHGG